MKKFKYLNNISKYSVLVLSLIMTLSSCDNEFNDPEPVHNRNTEPPVITSVAEARENKSVTEGVLENLYYIKGKNLATVKSIKYNGYEAGYNPVYVTDNLIISSIPEEAPYLNQANKLRLETEYGVTEYNFSLLTITEFVEETVDGESLVFIYGGDFTKVSQVLFVSGSEELGNLVERPATIKEELSTQERVVVVVPDGVIQAFIYVQTASGATVVSESYGFNYPIFTDELIGWTIGGWDGTQMISDEVALGEFSIRRESLNWGGLTLLPEDDGETLFVEDYSTISFQIYPAQSNTTRVNFALNDFAASVTLDLVPGQWNKFDIPISSIYPAGTAPETITRIDFQEASNGTTAPYLFYVDQFGFIE